MALGMTAAAVRNRNALMGLFAASCGLGLLLPGVSLAAAPGARTSAMTELEEALIVTPDLEPADTRQPVLGYLRLTEEGWQLDMLPGAVRRTGPFPVLTTTADSAVEDATSTSVSPYLPLLRVDF
ncbi:hypothetical protein [Hyalangium rubrum]|uniref:Uncharacterized protein n=1 Tax=Hyalangium rubrum TaxID=3103134 RepID=A0ABU5HBI3_9BACT|nr:hypothetical protein [Hyalangium sp. s54d21]MDY7230188.1 hypothetical protein [Hyalangium sp. s54d21]